MMNIVFQSDYGIGNGIAPLYGVCKSISMDLQPCDLSAQIPHFDMKAAAQNLIDVMSDWPASTIFVSLVDPLIGSNHNFVCLKTIYDNYVVTANNETADLLKSANLIKEEKDITTYIKEYASKQPTKLLHGRDLAYYAANLAVGNYQF